MKINIVNIVILNVLFFPFLFLNHIAFAESYESGVGVSFTLNPTINVTISGDLIISNLTPGDYKDSNNITVTTSSNSIAGYSLYANTGSSSNNSNELRKDGVDTNIKFTSITADKASLSDFTDNTWGYSYCNISTNCATSTNWTNYSYLPKYSDDNDKLLIASNTNTTTSLEFKIGARASTNQIAGEYTNIINFIGIANPNPQPIYMQNATLADCGKDMVDSRDNTVYTTALFADGKCWMTKNLDLAGGARLSSSNTDVTDTYINGFTTGGNLTKVGDVIILPASSTTGFGDDAKAFVYNSNRTLADNPGCTNPGCYSYYSWLAATLGGKASDGSTDVTKNNTDAASSICPKGWHLPNTRTNIDSNSDIRALMIYLGGSDEIQIYNDSTDPTGATISGALQAHPYNFILSGYYSNVNFHEGGQSGRYWTSTGSSTSYLFKNAVVNTFYNYKKSYGYSVRCVKSS